MNIFKIQQLLDLASSNFESGQFATAEKMAEEAMHLAEQTNNLPGRIQACTRLAETQFAQGKDIEAFKCCVWLTSLINNPDYSSLLRDDNYSTQCIAVAFNGLVSCGSVLPDIALEDLFHTINDGISWLEQIGKTEWLGQLRLFKGMLFLRQSRKEQALQELEVALASARRYPESVDLISCKLRLAEALISYPVPEFERSQRLIEEVLEETANLNDLRWGYQLKAQILREKDLNAAFTFAQKAVAIAHTLQSNPLLSAAYAVRGEIYVDMERYQEALADLNRAVDLNERNPNPFVLSLRGSLYTSMECYQEALADLNQVLALSGSNPDPFVLGLRGSLYVDMERYQEALTDLTDALDLGGPNPDPWTLGRRGELYTHMGRYREALADLSQAITLETKESWNFYARAKVYLQLGQSERVAEDVKTAIQIVQTEKNKIDYWRNSFNLALYTLFNGENTRAQAQYEQVIATCPSAVPLQGAMRVLKDWLKLQPHHQLGRQLLVQMSRRIVELQQSALS